MVSRRWRGATAPRRCYCSLAARTRNRELLCVHPVCRSRRKFKKLLSPASCSLRARSRAPYEMQQLSSSELRRERDRTRGVRSVYMCTHVYIPAEENDKLFRAHKSRRFNYSLTHQVNWAAIPKTVLCARKDNKLLIVSSRLPALSVCLSYSFSVLRTCSGSNAPNEFPIVRRADCSVCERRKLAHQRTYIRNRFLHINQG